MNNEIYLSKLVGFLLSYYRPHSFDLSSDEWMKNAIWKLFGFSFQRRALRLQQEKQKEELQREQAREREMERERQLAAKPAKVDVKASKVT